MLRADRPVLAKLNTFALVGIDAVSVGAEAASQAAYQRHEAPGPDWTHASATAAVQPVGNRILR